MPRSLRLLTLGHSYTVTANRALAHAVQRVFGSAWTVEVAAPAAFAAGRDLRATTLSVPAGESVAVHGLAAYNTRQIHTFCYGRRLKALLADNWDLVHCWQEPYTLAGAQVAYWTPPSTRLVFRSAQSLDKWYPPPFRNFERYTLRRSAGWICSGYTVEQNLLGRPGYAEKPYARIPLGVDTQRFRPSSSARGVVRRRPGWGDVGPPVVGFLGRFVPEKGLDLLTTALDGLRTPWRALLVGAGPMEPQLRAWAGRHGDAVRVCTDVTHDQVPPYLAAMDVMASPSQTTRHWREQFGRMLVEAFATGLPVVGSDSGEIPHVLGATGVVVPERDSGAWSEELGKIIDNQSHRLRLGEEGRARALAEFAWPVVAELHCRFFEEILDAPRILRRAAAA